MRSESLDLSILALVVLADTSPVVDSFWIFLDFLGDDRDFRLGFNETGEHILISEMELARVATDG